MWNALIHAIRRNGVGIAALLAIWIMASPSTFAQLDYGFSVSRGELIEMDDMFELQYGSRAGACGNRPSEDYVGIGFPFVYDGREYGELLISSNGYITFGEQVASPTTSDLSDARGPIIAGFWDLMRLPAGNNGCAGPGIVRFGHARGEEGQIAIVEYWDVSLGNGCNDGVHLPLRFQIRLYEGSNRIEFYYEDMTASPSGCSWGRTLTSSASIGLASSNGFLSIIPNGSEATSNTEEDEGINIGTNSISNGVLYSFCPAGVFGNPDEGGTERMQDGDILLEDVALLKFHSASFKPFRLSSFCASSFTYEITGPASSEYSITPESGSLPQDEGNTPTLTFRPTGLGVRAATLIVRDNLGFVSRSYALVGEGLSRVRFVGDVAEGGTPDLEDGDILMSDIKVRNGSTGDYTPITINVLASKEAAPDAEITYTLIDPTGQFSIDRTVDYVEQGGSSTPVITFSPSGNVDVQRATLIVDAEGEIRTYELRPFSSGPGARFYVAGREISNGEAFFRSVTTCVGGGTDNIALQIQAIGDQQFIMNNLDVFQVDRRIRPGTPPYPLSRDGFGRLVEVGDYFVSASNGSIEPLQFPIVLEPGESRTVYLTFAPSRPGMRGARAFFESNGENFEGLDIEDQTVVGSVNLDFVGIGIGSQLTNRAGDALPGAIVFEPTDVRSTVTATGYVRNSGICDMRISGDLFELVAGDIKEFSIVSAFPNSIEPGTGDFVLAPGAIDSVVVSFTPRRSGSRRASLRLQTNDSTLATQGITSRGELYIDLFGIGNVGLESRTVKMMPAVIGGNPVQGVAEVENTSADLLTITNIAIVSGDTEFMEDPSNLWPSTPKTLVPGETLNLGLIFVPDAATGAGPRSAVIEVTLDNGNVLTIDVQGIAGTRELLVAPTSLFNGRTVDVGDVARAFALVTNIGTFPVAIQNYQITGDDENVYKVTPIVNGIIQPGQTLPVEITYLPTAAGSNPAVFELTTNSINGTPAGVHMVTLGGEAASISQDPTSGSGATTGNEPEQGGDRSKNVEATESQALFLSAVAPNPTSHASTFQFRVPNDGVVTLGLFDANGRLVRSLENGTVSAGSHSVRMDLGDLAAGQYFLRLEFGGASRVTSVTLVK